MNLKLTWLGHASWMMETDTHKVLVDPFLTDNPAAKAEASELDADVILVTHGHFDHVGDVASIANRCQSQLVANFEIANWFSQNHDVKNSIGMNIGGWASVPFGRVKMTHAIHSSQMPDGSYGGNPGGYFCEFDSHKVYVAGDTALFSDLQLIGALQPEIAILPIGDLFTMGTEDSIQAIKWLSPRFVLPSHYGTWPPIEIDVENWAELVRSETDAEPIVLEVGESHLFSS